MFFQLTLNQAWLWSSQSRNVRSKNRRSQYPAIHVTSRILLRSSSTHEPNDPPHRVIQSVYFSLAQLKYEHVAFESARYISTPHVQMNVTLP